MFNIFYILIAAIIIIVGVSIVEYNSVNKHYDDQEKNYILAIVFCALLWPIVLLILIPILLVIFLFVYIGAFIGKILKDKHKEIND